MHLDLDCELKLETIATDQTGMASLMPNDSLAALKAREAELRRLNDQLERRKAVVVRRAEEAVVCELRCVRLHCT